MEKLTKLEKTRYVNKFLSRWEEIKNILYLIDIQFSSNEIIKRNTTIFTQSRILIIDDTLFNKYIDYNNVVKRTEKLILEREVKEHYKPLILLADNIANIFRRLYKEAKNQKKKHDIIIKFRK